MLVCVQSTQQTTWAACTQLLYYVTPTFKGFKAGLFYSFSGDEGERPAVEEQRFWNAAIRYSDENSPPWCPQRATSEARILI